MSDSDIEWCDKVWNPLVGCSKASAGCRSCYAERMGKRLRAMALADQEDGRNPGRKAAYIEAVDERGRWTGRVVLQESALWDPTGWQKPSKIFVNSMSDLFHPEVPFEYIGRIFVVMGAKACQRHAFQALTKHPGRAVEFFRWFEPQVPDLFPEWPLPNVWLGTSIEDQSAMEARLLDLLRCPAAVRWVSAEPLLGPLDFGLLGTLPKSITGTAYESVYSRLHWIVVGGESGPHARQCNIGWVRDVVRQGLEAGVRTFVKQLGANPTHGANVEDAVPFGPLKSKKGGDPAEWPADLRVRQWPESYHPASEENETP